MITHQQFANLRLSHFLAPETVEEFDSWQFMGREWMGEAIGATEFLRLKDWPQTLRLVNLDLLDLPPAKSMTIIQKLGLTVSPNMGEAQIYSVLGSPNKIHDFLPDRKKLDYQLFTPDPYLVSFTVKREVGLTGILVFAEELLPNR